MNEFNLPRFKGGIAFKTTLTLEELGDIISNKIFAGAQFGGKDQHIYEEIPAVFIMLFGWQLILQQGDTDSNKVTNYVLDLFQFSPVPNYDNKIHLNSYMEYIFIEKLKDIPEIEVIGVPVM